MSIEIILLPIALGAGSMALARVRAARRQESENPEVEGPENVVCFETQFKDLTLLQQALADFNYPCRLDEGQVQSSHGQDQLVFAYNDQNTLNAFFVGTAVKEAETFLGHLDSHYRKLVQQQSYETVINRAQKQGLRLEREEVSDDGSVVLTFSES